MSGASVGTYQIPNNPGQTASCIRLPGRSDRLRRKSTRISTSRTITTSSPGRNRSATSTFRFRRSSRFSSLHFVPDQVGDLEFNGVASTSSAAVSSTACKARGLAPQRRHTLHFGFTGSGEVRAANNRLDRVSGGRQWQCRWRAVRRRPPHTRIQGRVAPRRLRAGRVAITKQLTLEHGPAVRSDVGLRRRQPVQPADQLYLQVARPRRPFHAGYARYFTPAGALPVRADQSRRL